MPAITTSTPNNLEAGFEASFKSLRFYRGLAILAWTLVIAIALFWTVHDQRSREFDTARSVARAYFFKDQAVRQWGAHQGGVYVPVSDHTPPNPHLDKVPHRDVETTTGQSLTLMNPAYIIRQINDRFSLMYSDSIHITSLDPIRDENEPDAWERKVLAGFTKEADETAEIVNYRGESTLRLMRPMVTKKPCLKCHERHGYEVGDIRGGVSISVPMAPYQKAGGEHILLVGGTHGGIWLLGLFGIDFYTRRARRHLRERQRTMHSLNQANTYNRSVISALGEGLLGFDKLGRLTFINREGERLLGWPEKELKGKSIHGFIHLHGHNGRVCPESECPILDVLKTGEPYGNTDDGFTCSDTRLLPVSYIATPLFEDGQIAGGIIAFRDITEQKKNLERIEYLAHHDSLTGLPNRVAFVESLDHSLSHAHRYHHPFALLFLDLDNFGLINDSAGHSVGDDLLKQVADRLRTQIREPDIVARQGGDEFLILMVPGEPGAEAKHPEEMALHASVAAQRLLIALRTPFKCNGRELFVKASIGISLFPQDATDAVCLLKHADSAMYAAKNAGRDGFALYAGELDDEIHRRHELVNGLNVALEAGEFHLLYQPLVDLKSGRIFGVEALIRWESSTLGAVSPAEFIPVAEGCGLIVSIGNWVLGEACRQLAQWRKRSLDLDVAVNVSAHQFQRGDLLEVVRRTLDDTGVPASRLEFEITEGATMQASEKLLTELHHLNNLGIRFSLDDFGTGYSSLSRLKHLPISTLKIDKSFVDGIPDDRDDVEIVLSTIQLAQNLNKDSLAEGIESREQWRQLIEQGCDKGQGYYFSRPVSAEAVEDLLRNGGHWRQTSEPAA